MEKFALLFLLIVLLWFALRVAKFMMKLVAFVVIIILLVVGYYMYFR